MAGTGSFPARVSTHECFIAGIAAGTQPVVQNYRIFISLTVRRTTVN